MSEIGERLYTAPLFEEYSLQDLSAKTGMTLHYLVDVAEGNRPLRRRFRKTVCAVLQRPEAELFYPAAEE